MSSLSDVGGGADDRGCRPRHPAFGCCHVASHAAGGGLETDAAVRVAGVRVEPVQPAAAFRPAGELHGRSCRHVHAGVCASEPEERVQDSAFLMRELTLRRGARVADPEVVVDRVGADEPVAVVLHAERQVALDADVVDVFADVRDRTRVDAAVFPGGNVGIDGIRSAVDVRPGVSSGQRTRVAVGHGVGRGTPGESRHEGGRKEETQLLHDEPPLEIRCTGFHREPFPLGLHKSYHR